MASKTIWIVGGVVVAIGVVAYVAFKPGPANTDTAGTIVEAKRVLSDGASAPSSAGDRKADSPADQSDNARQRDQATERLNTTERANTTQHQ